MQYAALKFAISEDVNEDGDTRIILSRDIFENMLKMALKGANLLDESYYIRKYPDVAQAISKGLIANAEQHYYNTGYYENRLPRNIIVDEAYYLKENPDVAAAVKRGTVKTAQ